MGTRLWTKDEILNLLATNDRAVERALLHLYEKQTAAEQAVGAASTTNGVGFTKAHATKFTSFAERVRRGQHLTQRQLEFCREEVRGNTRIGCYWKQLLSQANCTHIRETCFPEETKQKTITLVLH